MKKQYRAMIFLKSGQMVTTGIGEMAEEEYKTAVNLLTGEAVGNGDVLGNYAFADTVVALSDISAIRLAEEE